jgi:hypothetical protein
MMKNTLDLIEQDFNLLASEFKKKNPALKDSCDRAIVCLNRLKHEAIHKPEVERNKIQYTELLEPLELSFRSM